jgi:UDP-N-acetylmuramoyl-tripeptide--D-alanyl-D-alanine ligase
MPKNMRAEIVSFGFSDSADVRCIDHLASANGGSLITAKLPAQCCNMNCRNPATIGSPIRLRCLAAVQAVGAIWRLPDSLADMDGLKGRGARHRLAVAGGKRC